MSSGIDATPAHPVPAAVGTAAAALTEICEAASWSLTDTELVDAITAANTLANQVDGLLVRLIGDATDRGIPTNDGAASLAQWVRAKLLKTPPDASKLARTVTATTAGPLAKTGAALSAGVIGIEQAAAICDSVTDLSAEVPAAAKTAAEQILLAEADRYDPRLLRRLGAQLEERIDPDGADTRAGAALEAMQRRAESGRYLTLRPDGHGAVLLRGRVDPVAAETITQAMAPFTKPGTGDDGPDTRTPTQRRADALVEVARHYLGNPDIPAVGGDRPHVVVTIDFDKLRDSLGGGHLSDGTPIAATTARRLACAPFLR